MTYLVTHPEFEPFLTNWFDFYNNYSYGMIIYNLEHDLFTTDGINWNEIKIDRL